MADDINRQILEELKRINEKLDRLNEPRGLSTPMKLVAIFVGFMILGPLFFAALSLIISFFNTL